MIFEKMFKRRLRRFVTRLWEIRRDSRFRGNDKAGGNNKPLNSIDTVDALQNKEMSKVEAILNILATIDSLCYEDAAKIICKAAEKAKLLVAIHTVHTLELIKLNPVSIKRVIAMIFNTTN